VTDFNNYFRPPPAEALAAVEVKTAKVAKIAKVLSIANPTRGPRGS
jgi:hypothetical protein